MEQKNQSKEVLEVELEEEHMDHKEDVQMEPESDPWNTSNGGHGTSILIPNFCIDGLFETEESATRTSSSLRPGDIVHPDSVYFDDHFLRMMPRGIKLDADHPNDPFDRIYHLVPNDGDKAKNTNKLNNNNDNLLLDDDDLVLDEECVMHGMLEGLMEPYPEEEGVFNLADTADDLCYIIEPNGWATPVHPTRTGEEPNELDKELAAAEGDAFSVDSKDNSLAAKYIRNYFSNKNSNMN